MFGLPKQPSFQLMHPIWVCKLTMVLPATLIPIRPSCCQALQQAYIVPSLKYNCDSALLQHLQDTSTANPCLPSTGNMSARTQPPAIMLKRMLAQRPFACMSKRYGFYLRQSSANGSKDLRLCSLAVAKLAAPRFNCFTASIKTTSDTT